MSSVKNYPNQVFNGNFNVEKIVIVHYSRYCVNFPHHLVWSPFCSSETEIVGHWLSRWLWAGPTTSRCVSL